MIEKALERFHVQEVELEEDGSRAGHARGGESAVVISMLGC